MFFSIILHSEIKVRLSELFEHFLWFGRISSPLFDWDPRRWQDDLALVHTVVPGSGRWQDSRSGGSKP